VSLFQQPGRVHPRPAATVVLVRPDDVGGFEILLTRRPPEMRFLGGFYVFPGGTVHRDDYTPSALERCRGLTEVEAQRILGNIHASDEALGHWVAVIRELFEEVGVLLCIDEFGEDVQLAAERKRYIEARRKAIVRRELDFASFLISENFFCDLSRVVYFDHWVTPDIYSMRFDTRFYIATLPVNQKPLARSEEVTHSLWVTPAEALARMDRREFPILPPTTTVLQRLGRLSTWTHLQAEFRLS
jgi:8-oxo-dGTP pyrophosphatase MutT (NUDIX family)